MAARTANRLNIIASHLDRRERKEEQDMVKYRQAGSAVADFYTKSGDGCECDHGSRRGAYTSGSVAESSGSAWQSAKTLASVDILALTQLHLVHN